MLFSSSNPSASESGSCWLQYRAGTEQLSVYRCFTGRCLILNHLIDLPANGSIIKHSQLVFSYVGSTCCVIVLKHTVSPFYITGTATGSQKSHILTQRNWMQSVWWNNGINILVFPTEYLTIRAFSDKCFSVITCANIAMRIVLMPPTPTQYFLDSKGFFSVDVALSNAGTHQSEFAALIISRLSTELDKVGKASLTQWTNITCIWISNKRFHDLPGHMVPTHSLGTNVAVCICGYTIRLLTNLTWAACKNREQDRGGVKL